jgi:hypothetical protein
MTHDEITAALRCDDWGSLGTQDMSEIADRLDLYRKLLRRCEWRLPCSAMRPDIEVLQRGIQEAIK